MSSKDRDTGPGAERDQGSTEPVSDGDAVPRPSGPEADRSRPGPTRPGDAELVSADPDAGAFGGDLPRRRVEPRVAAAFRVTYESLDELVEAYTVDISRGGLYVKTTRFLPLGAVVRLHLMMPEGSSELRTVARVAYVLDEAQALGHDRPAGMGMEFLDVGGAPIADQMARFIARVSPEVEVPPSPAGMSARVLVVDDDVWHRERAAGVMRDAGFDVVTTDNGVKALSLAMQIEPDLILTDVQMPVMDGWQLVRMLRARPSLAPIPVIFVTSLSSDEQRLQGYRLGVDDYIAKPFEEDELALRAQRVLTRARAYPRNATATKALRGSLSHVSLATLLAFLDAERRTGIMLLVRTDEIATLYLHQGRVVRVDLPDATDQLLGADRVHYLLDWTDGRFELADADVADEDTLGVDTSSILLAHAQRRSQE